MYMYVSGCCVLWFDSTHIFWEESQRGISACHTERG